MNDDLKQRILIIFAITFTFLLYLQYSSPTQKKDASQTEQAAVANGASAQATDAHTQPPTALDGKTPTASAEAAADAPKEDAVLHLVRVRQADYDAVFSARGAALVSYTLEKYTRTPQPENEYEDRVVLADQLAMQHLSLALLSVGTTDIRQQVYRLEAIPAGAVVDGSDFVPEGVRQEGDSLVFVTTAGPWEIRKTYRFDPNAQDGSRFGFAMTLDVRNTTNEAQTLAYRLVGPSGILPDDLDPRSMLEGLSAGLVDAETAEVDVVRWSLGSLAEADLPSAQADFTDGRSPLAWIGMKNRFFATLLLLNDPTAAIGSELHRFDVTPAYYGSQHAELKPLFLAKHQGEATDPVTEQTRKVVRNGEVVLKSSQIHVPAGQSVQHGFRFYGGPADEELLAFDPRLTGVIQYFWGFIAPLSRMFTKILYYLSAVFGNYGIAIIMLTIILRTLMHPLTRKGLASGHKMQKVQPRIKEIQKKYANDRAKLQQETMRLWQEEGVSPLGGCLPMLLQIPIFFALYGAFSQSFAGRHAAFIPGWIDDLSQPDKLYTWEAMLPVIGNSFNLLPILYMGLSMFQMSMQPKSDDPQMASQQKMMKLMPLVFAFFFYEMPSGLVLYFTCSSGYVIIEHWLIKRHLHNKDDGTPSAAPGTKGFQSATPSGAGAGMGVGQKRKGKKNR